MGASDHLIGYKGIFSQEGILIRKEDAHRYAMEHIRADESLRQEYEQAGLDDQEAVEWFFSGDFVMVFEEEEEDLWQR